MNATPIMSPIHPGEVLLLEYLEPLRVTQHRLAVAIGVPPRRINEIVLGKRAITEFNYRYDDAACARIFVGLALPDGRGEKEQLLGMVAAAGYRVVDMSDDEMAKLHVRYMVGGHARTLEHERLFRFEFPERPGALFRFLEAIGSQWNISLFHYRNHGSDHGRVLAGVQVPPAEATDFELHLRELHYPYVEETANPAYRMFLGA